SPGRRSVVAARPECQGELPFPFHRRRGRGEDRARRRVLSEGVRAEAHSVVEAAWAGGRYGYRHSSELDRAAGRVHPSELAGAHHRLAAAHAYSREISVS